MLESMPTAPHVERRERARPLSPGERREALLAATRPLLLEHGRATTTRMVAEAAGIAEGTVFRVFETKDALFAAVLEHEQDPTEFLARLAAIDVDAPLRERLVEAVGLLQQRFVTLFALMTAMAVPRPPQGDDHAERRRLAGRGMARLVAPDAEHFRVEPDEVVRLLRLLTFSGSHPHIASDHTLTPHEIVDVVLHGTLVAEGPGSCS
jgi:AcrR family transcriptional regulator